MSRDSNASGKVSTTSSEVVSPTGVDLPNFSIDSGAAEAPRPHSAGGVPTAARRMGSLRDRVVGATTASIYGVRGCSFAPPPITAWDEMPTLALDAFTAEEDAREEDASSVLSEEKNTAPLSSAKAEEPHPQSRQRDEGAPLTAPAQSRRESRLTRLQEALTKRWLNEITQDTRASAAPDDAAQPQTPEPPRNSSFQRSHVEGDTQLGSTALPDISEIIARGNIFNAQGSDTPRAGGLNFQRHNSLPTAFGGERRPANSLPPLNPEAILAANVGARGQRREGLVSRTAAIRPITAHTLPQLDTNSDLGTAAPAASDSTPALPLPTLAQSSSPNEDTPTVQRGLLDRIRQRRSSNAGLEL